MNRFIHADWQTTDKLVVHSVPDDSGVPVSAVQAVNVDVRSWKGFDVVMTHVRCSLVFNWDAANATDQVLTHVDCVSPNIIPPVAPIRVCTMMTRTRLSDQKLFFSQAMCEVFDSTLRFVNFPFYCDSTYDVNVQYFYEME